MTKNKKTKKHRFFWFVVKMQIVLMLIVLGGFIYYHASGYAKQVQQLRQEAITLVRESDEKTFVPSQMSIVYADDEEVISYFKGEKIADYVSYEYIPSSFVTAMISIEDKRFYSHEGIDFKAILRAAKAILETKSLSQGGSTITMQLARTIYLDNGKRWERKIKEMFIAVELEKLYSKNKIMEYYLNNIYFANGYYGIGAACKGYFSCELDELSLSQIAFLCAIPNSPTYYDPIVNYDNTIERRNRILDQMYEDGKITQREYIQASIEKIVLVPSHEEKTQRNNYVDTYVYYCATRALMELQGFEFQEYFDSEKEKQEYYQEYDELYADCQKRIYAEGYKIYTSIQMDKQEALQESVNSALKGFKKTNDEGIYQMQGAAVCMDNESGYVVAIVGGREQNLGYYTLNRAYQSYRQPGSAIKPLIVYTPFFEKGNNPETMIMDEEIEGGPKADKFYGEVTTRFAVQKSLNSAAWGVYSRITPQVGLQYLKNMHFTQIKESDYGLASALGGFTKGASVLEMAAAYATLENDGVYRTPTCIKKIVDADEKTIYISKKEGTRIYKENAARMMTNVLVSVIEEGTGKQAKLKGFSAAGKTGTTNDYKDGWFVGYTAQYTTSVWVGCDIPTSVDGLKGASYPATIWKEFMTYAHKGLTSIEFPLYIGFPKDEPETETEQPTESESEDVGTDSEQPSESESENVGTDSEQPSESESENVGTDSEQPSESESENVGTDSEQPSESESEDAGTDSEQPSESESEDLGTDSEQPSESESEELGTDSEQPSESESEEPETGSDQLSVPEVLSQEIK